MFDISTCNMDDYIKILTVNLKTGKYTIIKTLENEARNYDHINKWFTSFANEYLCCTDYLHFVSNVCLEKITRMFEFNINPQFIYKRIYDGKYRNVIFEFSKGKYADTIFITVKLANDDMDFITEVDNLEKIAGAAHYSLGSIIVEKDKLHFPYHEVYYYNNIAFFPDIELEEFRLILAEINNLSCGELNPSNSWMGEHELDEWKKLIL